MELLLERVYELTSKGRVNRAYPSRHDMKEAMNNQNTKCYAHAFNSTTNMLKTHEKLNKHRSRNHMLNSMLLRY